MVGRRMRPEPPAGTSCESWKRAKRKAEEILRGLWPSKDSEERRMSVIADVQKLLGRLGCQVYPYGSVPLKTYLPDGDLDLTAFTDQNARDSFALEVFKVLEAEEHKKIVEVEVKDVHLINAEVKLVKCLIKKVIVDISFDQRGGLAALCFLELVNKVIGKDHLYKRSIMLVKAWCYYESRILGAHHGLISTYALEILVLYIFNVFHKSLDCPLMVLHKFLEYYSKFDWDIYCITLHGPILLAFMPDLEVEAPEPDYGELLFDKEDMKKVLDVLCLFSCSPESSSSEFPKKHLNILDPLKDNNNLGRSVGKGNSHRIRSAFTYGARKLSEVFTQPPKHISDELSVFFMNTMDRHESGARPGVQDTSSTGPVDTTCNSNGLSCLPLQGKLLKLANGKDRITESKGLSPAASPRALIGEITDNKKSNQNAEGSHKHSGNEVIVKSDSAISMMQFYESVGDTGQLTTGKNPVKEAPNGNHSSLNGGKGFSLAAQKETSNGNPASNLCDLAGDLDRFILNLYRTYGFNGNFTQCSTISPTYLMHCHDPQDVCNPTSSNYMIHYPYILTSSPVAGFYSANEKPSSRGLGTYIPLTTYRSYRRRVAPSEERNSSLSYLPRRADLYENSITSSEVNLADRDAFGNCNGNGPGQKKLTATLAVSHNSRGSLQDNGFMQKQEGRHEAGPLAPLPLYAYSPELLKFSITNADIMGSCPELPSHPINQYAENGLVSERPSESYQLNDEDFPPLPA